MVSQCTKKFQHPVVVFALAIAVVCSQKALAGPVPMPLEAYLDTSKNVVVGKITKIEPVSQDKFDKWKGIATIEVSEVLKGPKVKTLEVECATYDYSSGQAASPPRVYREGESGIWVPSTIYTRDGLLPVERKAEVVKKLKWLEERKWSSPVNGLRTWAGVVNYGYYSKPVIIFAVQNVSKSDIYIPSKNTAGFITATATSADKQYNVTLSRSNLRSPVYCGKLSAGEITYLHPGYSFIGLRENQELPDGKYTVVLACRNAETKGTIGHETAVTAWVGDVSAPAVDITLESQKSN